MSLKFGIQIEHSITTMFYSNNDPRLTFDLFMQRSAMVPYAFIWEMHMNSGQFRLFALELLALEC